MTDILPTARPPAKNRKYAMQAIDFVERVVSTGLLSAYAVWAVAPHVDSVRVALYAGGGSALKYAAKQLAVWQSAHIADE